MGTLSGILRSPSGVPEVQERLAKEVMAGAKKFLQQQQLSDPAEDHAAEAAGKKIIEEKQPL